MSFPGNNNTKQEENQDQSPPRKKVRIQGRVKRAPCCFRCKRKLTLIFQRCACGKLYCADCFDMETHECPKLEEALRAREELAAEEGLR